VPRSDFAQEAADLLSVANTSQARALNQLVALATRQVTACSGATAGLWHGTEPVVRAASHPDLPALMSVQLSSGRGPVLDALAQGGPVSCPDTLAEDRWPEYAEAGLRCGVRCSVTLVYLSGAGAVTLSLFGARPLSAGAESRALVDQAKGMLMQVLGCSAEDALDKMRQISQEENLRVTDIAQRIIDSRGTGGLGPARAQRRRRDARAARPNVPDKA